MEYGRYPCAKRKGKWWVAHALTQEEISFGAYETENFPTRKKAEHKAFSLVENRNAIVAYVVKRRQTEACVSRPGTITDTTGLRCSNWTPYGNMKFIPRGEGIPF